MMTAHLRKKVKEKESYQFKMCRDVSSQVMEKSKGKEYITMWDMPLKSK